MQPSGVPSVPRFVLVTDLDHTLYDPDDADHLKLLRFNGVWRRHCAKDCLLVYSTGRSLAKFQQLKVHFPGDGPSIHAPWAMQAQGLHAMQCARESHQINCEPLTRRRQAKAPLLEPDLLICSVGTGVPQPVGGSQESH